MKADDIVGPRYSIERLTDPNWVYVSDRLTGDCRGYYEWHPGVAPGAYGSESWAMVCADQRLRDCEREDAERESAAGLRRLGNAVARWAGMACVVAGKCRPCVGTGIDYAETGPFPCEACDGRGYGPVRP